MEPNNEVSTSIISRLSIIAAQSDDAGTYVCVVFLPGASKLFEAFDFQVGSVKVVYLVL